VKHDSDDQSFQQQKIDQEKDEQAETQIKRKKSSLCRSKHQHFSEWNQFDQEETNEDSMIEVN
jgi:hypothetical protein